MMQVNHLQDILHTKYTYVLIRREPVDEPILITDIGVCLSRKVLQIRPHYLNI